MAKYKKVDVSEQQLEDLVRQHAEDIEEGMCYVDHQHQTGSGRLDVLMVDSGKSLVVAELKVVEEDGMLMQAVDYYDYARVHIEALARLYGEHGVQPTQPVRLFLIAPSFSQSLVNRCKWLDVSISLFTYTCITFEGSDDIVPVFSEQTIPSVPDTIERPTIEGHLDYITDTEVLDRLTGLLEEIKQWAPSRITMDAVKQAISIKVSGRVFAYVYPRRKHFWLATYNADDKWTEYAVREQDDLEHLMPLVKASLER